MANSSDAAEVRRAHRTELSPLRFLERSVLVYPGISRAPDGPNSIGALDARDDDLRARRARRADHARPARARQRDHARDAARAGGLRRARQPRPRGPRDRAGRERHRVLRRLRPRRLGRGRRMDRRLGGSGGAGRARRWTRRSMAANHDPDGDLGPGHRLPDDVAERPRLHEPVPLREAGALQGPRLLRRRRHRHGALLGPAGGRRRRQDRLPAGAGLGLADDGAVGRGSGRRGPSGCC